MKNYEVKEFTDEKKAGEIEETEVLAENGNEGYEE